MCTQATPYVGTAAGTEPWGQHVYPVGNLMIVEEKVPYSCIYRRIFVFAFPCRYNWRSGIGSISGILQNFFSKVPLHTKI